MGEGLFPVGRYAPLDEPSLAFAPGFVAVFGAFEAAFVLDVADCQPEQLDHGLVVGELATVAADLAQLVVERFDAVGGVHHPAEHGRELQERDGPVPRAFPRGGHRRVSPAELSFRELAERLFRGLSVGRAVHAPERRAHPLPVVVGDEPVGRVYQVRHAGLATVCWTVS